MRETVVRFWGLCAFVERPNLKAYEVHLPSGQVVPASEPKGKCELQPMDHVATLAIALDDLARIPDKLGGGWIPTSVVHYGNVQVVCWNLASTSITFDVAPATIPNWVPEDRKKSINLRSIHTTTTAQATVTSGDPDCASLKLQSGRIESGPGREVTLAHGGKKASRVAARSLDWYPEVTKELTIKSNLGDVVVRPGAAISVTNASRNPRESHEHFNLYYNLLTPLVRCDDRAHLERFLTEDTYDCVPPATEP